MTGTGSHPDAASLALYAGNDGSVVNRVRLWPHVSRCADCKAEIAAFRLAQIGLKRRTTELPETINWDRLAREMTANINLGLEAGECVAPFTFAGSRSGASRWGHFDWRAAGVITAMLMIMAGAWFLNPPARRAQNALRAAQIELRTTPLGLELNENGNSLVLMHSTASSGTAPLSPAMVVSAPGSLRARYVDSDTGQITINHVYSQ